MGDLDLILALQENRKLEAENERLTKALGRLGDEKETFAPREPMGLVPALNQEINCMMKFARKTLEGGE